MSNVIYALHYQGKIIKDRKELWKKYSKKYGDGGLGLQGWKAPKSVYFTLGRAKAAIHHLPQQIQSKVEIVEYWPTADSIGVHDYYCDQCDGSGKYKIHDGKKWNTEKCICSEPQE